MFRLTHFTKSDGILVTISFVLSSSSRLPIRLMLTMGLQQRWVHRNKKSNIKCETTMDFPVPEADP